MAESGAVLPRDTWDNTKARAQRILDLRGKPPYNGQDDYATCGGMPGVSADEAHVLSEFVQFWLPFIHEKEKKK